MRSKKQSEEEEELTDKEQDELDALNEKFTDEDVLRDDYDPSRILERDEVLSRYLQMFSEVIRGKRPRNVFVHSSLVNTLSNTQ